ncbi:SIMPL domain-containing protein [Pontibacter burrus]|uniref:SIMPL domain-containing protein n=1 Tax=Pontibacter burrus TaxID=2704466 RepID=A0A6B3LSS9_9BACT|nr:SIMPL domain-containing protein [Pontibacter burrus]NEM97276.1 SIMPL domain-containing protein [Pontibacter burrus]
MKNIFWVLIAVLLVSCQTDSTLAPAKFKTIMIKSVGEVETLPDMATFHINLNCLQKSVKGSKQCLVEKSNELNSKLLSFGIKQDDILTTSVNMNKSYSWKNNSQVFEGYNSSTSIYIKLRNISKLDQIYTELLENRNLELSGLTYAHSKIDSLKNEAYVDALKKANALADKLLTELPASEKEILKIGNVEISASMPEANQSGAADGYAVAEVAAQNRAVNISKGTVLVNATLFVEYQIK